MLGDLFYLAKNIRTILFARMAIIIISLNEKSGNAGASKLPIYKREAVNYQWELVDVTRFRIFGSNLCRFPHDVFFHRLALVVN